MSLLRKVKFINSIQVSLALAISLIVVTIISGMGWLLYDATDKVVADNSSEMTGKIIKQVNYDIEYYLKAVETTIDSIKYSYVIANYFEDDSEENKDEVIKYLNSLLVNRDDIINIALIRETGEIVTNNTWGVVKDDTDFTEESYYTEAIKTDQMYVSSSHVQNIISGQYKWVVSCASAYKTGEKSEVKGVILVDLNYSLIEDMVSRIAIGEKGYIFIVDELGQMVYHPKRELIYSGLRTESIDELITSKEEVVRDEVDGETVDYIVAISNFSNWRVVGKVFVDDINVYQETLKKIFISMIFTALVIAVSLSVILAGTILGPVKRLLSGIYTFQSGQLDVEVQVESENELGLLTSEFNRMTKRIKALVDENKKSERSKRKSELDALQAQINPHFLYNTLDSIVWMGEAGKSKEVVKMTSALARLFRISISKGEEYITIKQEIEHIESYLAIQYMRYGNRLKYKISVDERLLDIKIIKILLQPIVENAIYHGIKQLPGEGLIQIRVTKETDETMNKSYLHIEVEDNGMGMNQETIEKLLKGGISPKSKGGVGVYNVDQRIKLYYGDEYGLDIKTEMFEGTTVIFKLPITQGGPNEKI